MKLRRTWAALTTLCALAATAVDAQVTNASLVGPPEASPEARAPRVSLPNFTAPPELSAPGAPRRNGILAAWPVNERLQLGVGRFRVSEARPRTNLEMERAPTDMRRRDRGIAAIGFSLSF